MSKGFINITIESLEPKVKELPKQPMSLFIKFGEAVAKSEPGKWTNSYLLKIPEEIPRLSFQLTYWGIKPVVQEKQKTEKDTKSTKETKKEKVVIDQYQTEQDVVFGECRFDVSPFFQFQGKTHIFESDLIDQQGVLTAHIKLKLTYYAAKSGKLRIKITNLLLTQSISEQYKNLSVRFRLGPFVKTSPLMVDNTSWNQPLQLVILTPNLNLTIELLSDGQNIGEFIVYNIQKQGYLVKEPKTIQNGLYWKDKSSGKIKYEVQNIQ